ncbi:MAG: dihydroneopterin aldolase [Calditrichia bacterium]
MGFIRLNNMIFYAHHGYYQAERELGQKFQLDLEMEVDFSKTVESDNLHDAVNYEAVYKKVHHIFNSYKFSLLEALADRIAREVLDNFEVKAIRVKVRKPQVPLNGFLDNVEVELYRENERLK